MVEYKLLEIDWLESDVEDTLNALARERWRVVSFKRSQSRPHYEVLLERPSTRFYRA
jgi:hypothetical protein